MKPLPERRPPAFQLYASDTLADRRFLLMSAAERGVLLSMRMACWVSDTVPSDPTLLSRVLGLPVDDVQANLSAAVLGFFTRDGDEFRDPELDAQRAHLQVRRDIWAANGAKGGRPPQNREVNPADNPADNPAVAPADNQAGNPIETALSRAEKSRAESCYQQKQREEATSTNVSRRTSPAGARARVNGAAKVAA